MKRAIPIMAVLAIIMAASVTHAATYITKTGHPYAASEKTLKDAIRFLRTDKAAFYRLYSAGLVGVTHGGERVHLVKAGVFSGIVQVRFQGQTQVVFMPIEAIK